MVPSRPSLDRSLLAIVFAACSAKAPPPKPPTDIDVIAHEWKIEDHILSSRAALTVEDAVAYHGRSIVITETTYESPFQGTCENAGRTRRSVLLVDVALALDIPSSQRKHAVAYGLGKDLVEYKLTCGTENRVPPMTMFVAGGKAMTCFAGACYLMAH